MKKIISLIVLSLGLSFSATITAQEISTLETLDAVPLKLNRYELRKKRWAEICKKSLCQAPENLRIDIAVGSSKIDLENNNQQTDESVTSGNDSGRSYSLQLIKQYRLNNFFRFTYGLSLGHTRNTIKNSQNFDNWDQSTGSSQLINQSTSLSTSSLSYGTVGAPFGIEWHFRIARLRFFMPHYIHPKIVVYDDVKVNNCELIECSDNYEMSKILAYYNHGLFYRHERFSAGLMLQWGKNRKTDDRFQDITGQISYYF